MAGGARDPGQSVVSRALALLDAFDSDHPHLTLSELSRAADLPLATAHRLLGELVTWGAVVRRRDGAYEIGRRLWDLGLLAPVQVELREAAAPFLQDIHAATRDTVHLAVRDGIKALYVERISGRESVPVVSQVGSRLPLHTTGVGKVLLAFAPSEVVLEAAAHLTRETRHSIIEPGRLARDLAEVRRRGYARTNEEMSLGACSLAVPVVDRSGEVVAAVGIVVPPHRRNSARLVPRLAGSRPRHLAPDAARPHLPLAGSRPSSVAGPGRLDCWHADPGRDHRCGAGWSVARPPAPSRGRRLGDHREPLAGLRRGPDPGRRAGAGERRSAASTAASATGSNARGLRHDGIYLQWPGHREHLDFPDLCGRSVWIYGQTEVVKDLVAARLGRRDCRPSSRSATPRCTTSTPTGRGSPISTPPGAEQRLECDAIAGCDGFHGISRAAISPARATDLGADLPLRLARHLGRGRAVDRRADLRLAPGWLRPAQHAIADGEPALPPGRPGRGHRRLVGRPDLDRPADPVRPRTGVGAADRAGAGEERAADAQLRLDADARRAALPGGRRRAHRAADRGQGTQPGSGRRPPARARPRRARRRRAGPTWPTPTPTLRCNGFGVARISPGS